MVSKDAQNIRDSLWLAVLVVGTESLGCATVHVSMLPETVLALRHDCHFIFE